MNNKGQMGFGFIMSIVMLVVAILMITAFWSVIQEQFDGLRNQDQLNCKSTTDICGGVGSETICYNSTIGNSHGTTCAMVNIGPPLIFIMLIIGALGMLMYKGEVAPVTQGY